MHLDTILTMPQVAALAGWSRRRMLRALLRADAQAVGSVLRNVGTPRRPRWTTTLAALKKLAPAWCVDEESVEARLLGLEERFSLYEGVVAIHTERLVVLRDR